MLNQSDFIEVEIQSVRDGDDDINCRLYFGITSEDDHINDEDYFLMVFIFTHKGPGCLPPHNASGSFGKEYDAKIMWLKNNHTVDCFTSDAGYVWKNDTSNPSGINNGIGKCHHDGSVVTIEQRYPVSWGDPGGFDFSLNPNAALPMFLWLHDGDKKMNYSQIRESDNNFDYITFTVSCNTVVTSPNSVVVEYIVVGLIFTTAVMIIIRKKRK